MWRIHIKIVINQRWDLTAYTRQSTYIYLN